MACEGSPKTQSDCSAGTTPATPSSSVPRTLLSALGPRFVRWAPQQPSETGSSFPSLSLKGALVVWPYCLGEKGPAGHIHRATRLSPRPGSEAQGPRDIHPQAPQFWALQPTQLCRVPVCPQRGSVGGTGSGAPGPVPFEVLGLFWPLGRLPAAARPQGRGRRAGHLRPVPPAKNKEQCFLHDPHPRRATRWREDLHVPWAHEGPVPSHL